MVLNEADFGKLTVSAETAYNYKISKVKPELVTEVFKRQLEDLDVDNGMVTFTSGEIKDPKYFLVNVKIHPKGQPRRLLFSESVEVSKLRLRNRKSEEKSYVIDSRGRRKKVKKLVTLTDFALNLRSFKNIKLKKGKYILVVELVVNPSEVDIDGSGKLKVSASTKYKVK